MNRLAFVDNDVTLSYPKYKLVLLAALLQQLMH